MAESRTVVSPFGAPARRTAISNEGVAALAAAGFSEGFILRRVEIGPAELDLSVDGLTFLRQEGLSEALISGLQELFLRTRLETRPAPPAPPVVVPAKPVRLNLLVPEGMDPSEIASVLPLQARPSPLRSANLEGATVFSYRTWWGRKHWYLILQGPPRRPATPAAAPRPAEPRQAPAGQ